MSVQFQWRGQKVTAEVRERIDRALRQGAAQVVRYAQDLVSRPARRVVKRRKRNTVAGKKGSTYSVYVGSSPGQPPRMRTGVGRSSIRWVKEKPLSYRVLVAAPGSYMTYLDRGTSRVQARPWLRRAVEAVQPLIDQLVRKAGG